MIRGRRIALAVVTGAAAVSALLGTGGARAADVEYSFDSGDDSYAWSGGPFTASNPINDGGLGKIACAGADDPTCDHTFVEITDPGRPYTVTFTVQLGAGSDPADDYDLYVYDDRGFQVASSASGGTPPGGEVAQLVSPRSGTYEVRVQPWQVVPGSSFDANGVFREELPGVRRYDLFEQDCLEAVPAEAGVSGVTDGGETVSLDVAMVLDGVSQADAEAVMAKAAEAYAPLDIDLNVVSWTSLPIAPDGVYEGRETAEGIVLNELARAHFGGRRPLGSDVVYTMSSKDLYTAAADDPETPEDESRDEAGRDYGLLGVADCIGGVRFNDRAFATGEFVDLEFGLLGSPVTVLGDTAAKTAAHEIGHLMGAHHHYFNCVEGMLTETAEGELSPCTIMAPFVDLGSINFGQFDAAVVRGHALEFALVTQQPPPPEPVADCRPRGPKVPGDDRKPCKK